MEGEHWTFEHADAILMGLGAFAAFGMAMISVGVVGAVAAAVAAAMFIVVVRYYAPVEPIYGPHH